MSETAYAYWILRPDLGDCIYECSKCAKVRDAYLDEDDNFCSNCGATMVKHMESKEILKALNFCTNGECPEEECPYHHFEEAMCCAQMVSTPPPTRCWITVCSMP